MPDLPPCELAVMWRSTDRRRAVRVVADTCCRCVAVDPPEAAGESAPDAAFVPDLDAALVPAVDAARVPALDAARVPAVDGARS